VARAKKYGGKKDALLDEAKRGKLVTGTPINRIRKGRQEFFWAK